MSVTSASRRATSCSASRSSSGSARISSTRPVPVRRAVPATRRGARVGAPGAQREHHDARLRVGEGGAEHRRRVGGAVIQQVGDGCVGGDRRAEPCRPARRSRSAPAARPTAPSRPCRGCRAAASAVPSGEAISSWLAERAAESGDPELRRTVTSADGGASVMERRHGCGGAPARRRGDAARSMQPREQRRGLPRLERRQVHHRREAVARRPASDSCGRRVRLTASTGTWARRGLLQPRFQQRRRDQVVVAHHDVRLERRRPAQRIDPAHHGLALRTRVAEDAAQVLAQVGMTTNTQHSHVAIYRVPRGTVFRRRAGRCAGDRGPARGASPRHCEDAHSRGDALGGACGVRRGGRGSATSPRGRAPARRELAAGRQREAEHAAPRRASIPPRARRAASRRAAARSGGRGPCPP